MYTSRVVPYRTFKNFGHKRQPVPLFTVLWQGFLTFTFIGLGVEWKRMARFFFGEEGDTMVSPVDPVQANNLTSNQEPS